MCAARLSPQARRDALEAARWIEQDSRAAARALWRSIRRMAELIGEHPDVGTVRPELADACFRFLPMRGFPYLIVYNPDRRPPVILRVVHGARDLPELLRDLRPL
jgi:toxin ParE1/3/4